MPASASRTIDSRMSLAGRLRVQHAGDLAGRIVDQFGAVGRFGRGDEVVQQHALQRHRQRPQPELVPGLDHIVAVVARGLAGVGAGDR